MAALVTHLLSAPVSIITVDWSVEGLFVLNSSLILSPEDLLWDESCPPKIHMLKF